jgi:hypothetical protein
MLSLNKYRDVDLRVDTRNPFRVHKDTEKLLIAREKEREEKEFRKAEKDLLHIFEKEISTRRNRAGVIREISNIKASNNMLKKRASEVDEFGTEQNKLELLEKEKNKINIFEEGESALMAKNEGSQGLFKWGGALMKDERSVVPYDTEGLMDARSQVRSAELVKRPSLKYLQSND